MPDVSGGSGLSVGRAAARIGVAASTLRTWERRYGLSPSGRSAGGHRRYTPDDLDLLLRVHHLVLAGEPPARAALLARTPGEAGSRGAAPGGPGPGGRVLAVPGADARARGLARAATALDVDAAVAIVEAALAREGVVRVWEGLLRPVLAAAGAQWARTGTGVEVEHLLTEAAIEALRAHRRSLPGRLPRCRPSCWPARRTTSTPCRCTCWPRRSAERGVPARLLGARVPAEALAATVRRSGALAAFVWAQLPDARAVAALALAPSRPAVRLVAGGPGWSDADLPPGCLLAQDLEGAVDALAAADPPPVPTLDDSNLFKLRRTPRTPAPVTTGLQTGLTPTDLVGLRSGGPSPLLGAELATLLALTFPHAAVVAGMDRRLRARSPR